ncbi:hypothetical protein DLAC_07353 [Tieghemostelium lacteum]|uniref:Peptidase S1 domain-containing protein n=1 Tax=Tieghemostelium lacteum TaxID=361077 RepID=A0A151ZCD7_TIELA|nr:hypothetical protein DLAC_07353 [Tieghemostelium lacteum]|eukprot:KYQ91585.1 hypothetical protein DLAC_07353 [Tieghemostelium lacteum]
MDKTDYIAIYPNQPISYFIDGPQSLETDYGERVFQDKLGMVDGKIMTLNSKGKITQTSLNTETKSMIEKSSAPIGRLFVSYSNGQENKWFAGSGFLVSPTHVITAYHVVKPTHENFTLNKVYIYFGVDATFAREVISDKLPEMEDAFELKEVPRDFDKKFTKPMTFKDTTWKTTNDIAILKFVDKTPGINYLFPLFSENTDGGHFVVGYPGFINVEKFKIDYGDNHGNALDNLYSQVQQDTLGFQHKTVSINQQSGNESGDNLSSHQCPTLRGTSGGLIGKLNNVNPHFVGIHIGGDGDMQINYWISIKHPLFVHIYFNNIANEQFILENQTILQPYIEYYNSLQTHTTN